MKILIVEDDLELQETIAQMLGKAGYSTFCCSDGEDALYHILNKSQDLVILDRMIPQMNGLSVLQQARAQKIDTPVLMLTAMNAVGDRVEGLVNGADDYLSKPFDMRELLARVQALVRRPASIEDTSEIQLGNTTLETAAMLLKGPKSEVYLTRKQADFLELFMRNASPVLTRSTIFNRVWGPAADVDESIIDTYVAVIRRRLKAVGASYGILTNRGIGYRIQELEQACIKS